MFVHLILRPSPRYIVFTFLTFQMVSNTRCLAPALSLYDMLPACPVAYIRARIFGRVPALLLSMRSIVQQDDHRSALARWAGTAHGASCISYKAVLYSKYSQLLTEL